MAEAAAVLGLSSRGGIYRKLASGELPHEEGRDGVPLIERDGLEAVWAGITRQQRNSPRVLPPEQRRPAPRLRPVSERRGQAPAVVSDVPDYSEEAVLCDVPDYNEERALHEREKRLLAELSRQEKEGRLLPRDAVMQSWGQAVNLTRVRLLGVPSSVKQRIPHLEPEEVEVITGLIREALDELASGEMV